MQKLSLLISFYFFTIIANAQVSNKSVLSYHGIGQIQDNSAGSFEALGNSYTGIFSNHTVNSYMPATNTSLLQPSFDLSFTTVGNVISTKSNDFNSSYSYIRNFAFGFPFAKRFGLSAAITPLSRYGYSITENTQTSLYNGITTYKGSGGLNQGRFGFGVDVYKDTSQVLTAGLGLNYIFGYVTKEARLTIDEILANYYNTIHANSINVSDFQLSYSLHYKKQFKKYSLGIGALFTPEVTLSTTERDYFATYQGVSGSESVKFTVNDTTIFNEMIMPLSFSVGFSNYIGKKLMITMDYRFREMSKLQISSNNSIYNNAQSLHAGIEFIPDYKSVTKLFKVMRYRLGGQLGTTGLELNGHPVNKYSLSAGLGIPLIKSVSRSSLNFALVAGKYGNTEQNLISEQFLNFTIGLTILPHKFDRWFYRRKIE